MNYLAHAYLSFNNPPLLLGNMISDFVKGKKQFQYPEDVHKGILLHRAIDNFTDFHEVTKEAQSVFKKEYRLYSGAFIDVVYDHFLAIDHTTFNEQSLLAFSKNTYQLLEQQEHLMPPPFKNIFFYMRSQNWLYGYRTRKGIYESFGGLVKRAAYLHDSSPAIEIFESHYNFLEDCFRRFWKDIKPYAIKKLDELWQA